MDYNKVMPQVPKKQLPPLEISDKKTGEIIAKVRKQRGMTQMELADKIGITRVALSAYESGRVRIYDEMLARFALALDISSDILLGFQKNQNLTKETNLRIVKRINEIENLPPTKRKSLLDIIDSYLKANQ